jgi:hypothetical protein
MAGMFAQEPPPEVEVPSRRQPRALAPILER